MTITRSFTLYNNVFIHTILCVFWVQSIYGIVHSVQCETRLLYETNGELNRKAKREIRTTSASYSVRIRFNIGRSVGSCCCIWYSVLSLKTYRIAVSLSRIAIAIARAYSEHNFHSKKKTIFPSILCVRVWIRIHIFHKKKKL